MERNDGKYPRGVSGVFWWEEAMWGGNEDIRNSSRYTTLKKWGLYLRRQIDYVEWKLRHQSVTHADLGISSEQSKVIYVMSPEERLSLMQYRFLVKKKDATQI